MTLEELLREWQKQKLDIGTEYPVTENFCRYCSSEDLVFVVRLEATPDASLSGAMPKMGARSWPYLKCKRCGRESRGK
jgi:hypothetical protein